MLDAETAAYIPVRRGEGAQILLGIYTNLTLQAARCIYTVLVHKHCTDDKLYICIQHMNLC